MTSNAGFRVEIDNCSILIDAFNEGRHVPYCGTPASVWQRELARGADVLFYTHLHDDHFSPKLTAAFLRQHPKTQLIAPVEAEQILRELDVDLRSAQFLSDPVHTFQLRPGLRLTAFETRHIGTLPGEVAHYSVLLQGSEVFFDSGDASASVSNFRLLSMPAVDLAACSMLFFLSGGRTEHLLKDILHAKKTLVMHLPDPALDTQGLTQQVRSCVAALQTTDVFFAESSDTVYSFEAG